MEKKNSETAFEESLTHNELQLEKLDDTMEAERKLAERDLRDELFQTNADFIKELGSYTIFHNAYKEHHCVFLDDAINAHDKTMKRWFKTDDEIQQALIEGHKHWIASIPDTKWQDRALAERLFSRAVPLLVHHVRECFQPTKPLNS